MAYNSRTRDPLLEAQMQATIRKRGIEVAGFVLILLAIACAIALITHSPDDTNFLNSTSGEIEKALFIFVSETINKIIKPNNFFIEISSIYLASISSQSSSSL